MGVMSGESSRHVTLEMRVISPNRRDVCCFVALIVRRLKDVRDELPHISQSNLKLPPKREIRLLCPLSKMQHFWYKRILLQAAYIQSGNRLRDQKTGKLVKISGLMSILRTISNHPFGMPNVEDDPEKTTVEILLDASGKMKMLDRLLQYLIRQNRRAVIFSQFTGMLDII